MKRDTVRSIYVRLRKGKHYCTCEILPEVFADFNRGGWALGIECTAALEIQVTATTVGSRHAQARQIRADSR